MSLDTNTLVKSVKKAAVDAVNAANPMHMCFGTVLSNPPLEIQVDQKLILGEKVLILTDNVRDYVVNATPWPDYHTTEATSGGSGEAAFASHTHRYEGKKKWKIHNDLEAGEKVILLRCDGGQQYIVLDRWEAREE